MDMDGVNSAPYAGMPRISSVISAAAGASTGASRLTMTATTSEMRTGTSGPRLSESLPTSGERPASIAAESRKVRPINGALTPSRLSRSGASTSIRPNAIPASAISHIPPVTCGSRRVGHAALRPCCSSASAGAGSANAARMSSPPATAAAENAGPVPIRLATAPITGPSSAPPTAAPSAVPISSPRRSGGPAVASQASPPAQMHEPPTPWTNRAMSSTYAADDQPNTNVDTLIRTRPSSTTVRSPSRTTSRPLGSAEIRVPAG
jgi:hypothetical protein